MINDIELGRFAVSAGRIDSSRPGRPHVLFLGSHCLLVACLQNLLSFGIVILLIGYHYYAAVPVTKSAASQR